MATFIFFKVCLLVLVLFKSYYFKYVYCIFKRQKKALKKFGLWTWCKKKLFDYKVVHRVYKRKQTKNSDTFVWLKKKRY